MARVLLCWAALGAAALGCRDPLQRVEEVQRKREADKKAYHADKQAKLAADAPKVEEAVLDKPWADSGYLKMSSGRPCPEGLWALFPQTPGEGAERAANESQREQLSKQLKASTFYAVLSHGSGVVLRKYNAKKKHLTVEVDGVLECFDTLGLVTVAWGEPVKTVRAPQPDDDEEEYLPVTVWRAQPLLFRLPFSSAASAQAFRERQGIGLAARLVFTLGSTEVNRHTQKSLRPLPDGGASGGDVDWGAGRLVRVRLTGVRVATDHERVELATKLGR